MPQHIIVVDDESIFTNIVRLNLEMAGYSVTTINDSLTALSVIRREQPDLIFLDIMMPGKSGLELFDDIRKELKIPVMFLTTKSSEVDQVKGLEAGAEDYITKPFSANELVARVDALMRRIQMAAEPQKGAIFTHGDLRIDLSKAAVTIKGKPVFLSAIEYKLLTYLAENVGEVKSKKEILEAVWGPSYIDEKELCWVTISRLRKSIEEDPHSPKHIIIRPGLGYFIPNDEGEPAARVARS